MPSGAKPGERRGGRQKGTPNSLTRTVKEQFEDTFRVLQEHKGAKLDDWAKDNPTEFYKLASKLIPAQINATVNTQESAIDLLARGITSKGTSGD